MGERPELESCETILYGWLWGSFKESGVSLLHLSVRTKKGGRGGSVDWTHRSMLLKWRRGHRGCSSLSQEGPTWFASNKTSHYSLKPSGNTSTAPCPLSPSLLVPIHLPWMCAEGVKNMQRWGSEGGPRHVWTDRGEDSWSIRGGGGAAASGMRSQWEGAQRERRGSGGLQTWSRSLWICGCH